MRKYNKPTDVQNSTKPFDTVITFRTQQLMDLFLNEMQGQISDGKWENSRNTNWLWRNIACVLGDTTNVAVRYDWIVGKKSYPLDSFLWDCVGDRIMDENGFVDRKEATAAWNEIVDAIKNPHIMVSEERQKYFNGPETRRRIVRENLYEKVVRIFDNFVANFPVEIIERDDKGRERVTIWGDTKVNVCSHVFESSNSIVFEVMDYTTSRDIKITVRDESEKSLIDAVNAVLKIREIKSDIENRKKVI